LSSALERCATMQSLTEPGHSDSALEEVRAADAENAWHTLTHAASSWTWSEGRSAAAVARVAKHAVRPQHLIAQRRQCSHVGWP